MYIPQIWPIPTQDREIWAPSKGDMNITRVVIADDHPFIRVGIRGILQRMGDVEVAGEAEDGFQALSLVYSLEPDILLLDMEMPGLQGIDVARELKKQGQKIPILVISAHEDKHFILGMLKIGAAGYLVKNEVPETVSRAIRGIVNGRRGWVSRKVAAMIGVWMHGDHPDQLILSKNDIRALQLYSHGKRSDEIGSELGWSRDQTEQQIERAIHAVRARLEQAYG
jgi:DNA-binding NarL/FixJ family response regulator